VIRKLHRRKSGTKRLNGYPHTLKNPATRQNVGTTRV
jgi:hypothetical protein